MKTIREENSSIRKNNTIRESLNTPKINVTTFREYEVIEELDNIGAEADIYIIQKNNKKYFLKLYRKGIELKDDIFEKIKNIDSEYFIKLIEYGFDETTQRFYEISEYIKAQTLNKNIDIDYFIKALNEALNILHQNQIIHHDLKPNNVLVLNSKIKLIDFGVSTILENEFTKKLTSIKGTYSYFSPESISGYVGKEIDYWSFGIIVLELLDKNPFAGLNQTTIIHYLATKPIPIPNDLPQKYQILLKGLLTKDPHKRWGYNEVKLWLENRFSNIYYEEIELPKYKFNNQELTLQELAQKFLKPQNFELAQKHIARGYITKFLEKIEDYDFVLRLDEYEKVVEKLIYFCYSQNPTLPFSLYGKIIDEEFIFSLFLKKMKNEIDEIDNKILDTLLKTDIITIYEQTTNNQTNLKEFISKFNVDNLEEFFMIENLLKQDGIIITLMFEYIQKDKLSQYDIKIILDYAIQKDNIQLFSEYYKFCKRYKNNYIDYIYNNGLDFNVILNSSTPSSQIIKYLINKDKNLILKYFSNDEIVEFIKNNMEYTRELFKFVGDENLTFILDKAIETNNKEIIVFLLSKNVQPSDNSKILSFLIKNSLLDKYKYIINYKHIRNIKDYGYIQNKHMILPYLYRNITVNDAKIYSLNATNNKYIIVGCIRKIQVWDFESGECIKTFNSFFNWSVILTKDDRYIVSGSRLDGTIKIWDFESGECIKTLKGHTSYVVSSVTLTKDDRYIVSGSNDETIKIWDFESGECIKTLKGHTSYVSSVTLTKDDRYIVSGSRLDGTIKIWEFNRKTLSIPIHLYKFDYNILLDVIKNNLFDIVEVYENLYQHQEFEMIEKLVAKTNTKNELLKVYIKNKVFNDINETLLEKVELEYFYLEKLISNNLFPKVISIIDNKFQFIELLVKKDKNLVYKYFNTDDIREFLIKNIEYTKELYEFIKNKNLTSILDKAIKVNNIEIIKFLLSKDVKPSNFNKNKLLKFLVENNLYQQIDKNLYNFIDLENTNINYKHLEQLIINNLYPEKITFKSEYEKKEFLEFLLIEHKTLIRKYFDISYLFEKIRILNIENKQELIVIFTEKEKLSLFNQLKKENLSLVIEIYKNKAEYLAKLKQILKDTKDKEIKELFYKNGIKLSLSEKLFGIKE